MGTVVEWLERLGYGAESRWTVMSSIPGLAIRRLETCSVDSDGNVYMFQLRED